MMGRSHVIGGAALAASGAALLSWSSRSTSLVELGARLPEQAAWLRTGSTAMLDRFVPWELGSSPTLVGLSLLSAGLLLFVVGTLWPDIDSEHTMLGRHLHLPLRHRGWTHTDWLFVPAIAGAWFEPSGLLAWFVLGWGTHLVLDEISKAGRVHFYPLTKYKVYVTPDGREVVVKRFWTGLYKAGKPSEYIVLCALVIGALAACWAVWWPR